MNNQSSVAAGTGTLYLNGSIAQIVSGTQPFNTFNLNTDNSLGITLNTNLTVAGVHTFTNGRITTSATPNFLVYQAGSSYSGASDARHVNGWVKKFGTTNFTFPVGNGTYLRSADIQSLSGSSEFNARYYNGPTPNSTNVIAPLLLVDVNEYLDITRVSGGTASIGLNWDNSKVAMPNFILAEIRVAGQSAGFWSNQGGSASGNILTTGNITSAPVGTFGLFTLGSINWTVPVKLLQFTGVRKSGFSQLDWAISRESNASLFDIERSDDGRNFSKIGAVLASSGTSYGFNDYLPVKGNAWYRLRIVDRNNAVTYSTVVMVTDRVQNEGLYVVSNPVTQNIYVSASGSYIGQYDYSIYTSTGQLVQRGNINTSGITTIPLASMVTAGTYILDMRNSNHRLTQKIIVR